MKKLKGFVFWMFWTLSRGDSDFFCVFGESCVLPCSFQVSSKTEIHWIHLAAGESPVHSFYDSKDQLDNQDQNYRDRTSLFWDQISSGNASLLLRRVKIQDQGRYKCDTNITDGKTSFITMNVDAPVSKVNISEEENRITCSSEGIYPEPELTWSTIPSSDIILTSSTSVHQTAEKLYSISSSLMVSDRDTDLIYRCTIRTDRTNRTASLNKRDAAARRGVAVVVGVVIVSALMGVLPCIFDKYKIKTCHKHFKKTEKLQQQEEELHQLNVSEMKPEINTNRSDEQEEKCSGNNPETQTSMKDDEHQNNISRTGNGLTPSLCEQD